MTITLVHPYVSAIVDDGDTSKVQPTDWNAEHTIEMATARVLGRVTASSGPVEELTGSQVKTLAGLDSAAWVFDVDVAGTADANISASVNTMYVRSIAGYSADRTLTLPATAAVGDRVGVFIHAGDNAYELLITAGSGDTLNGVAGGTAWSRLMITGEAIVAVCVVANATWVILNDGRIPIRGAITLSTAATAEVAATITYPTDKGGVWTSFIDVGDVTVVATDRITARRAGNYLVTIFGGSTLAIADQQYIQLLIEKTTPGSYQLTPRLYASSSATTSLSAVTVIAMAIDDFLRFRWRSSEGGKGLSGAQMTMTEVL